MWKSAWVGENKTWWTITVLHISIFTFLNSKLADKIFCIEPYKTLIISKVNRKSKKKIQLQFRTNCFVERERSAWKKDEHVTAEVRFHKSPQHQISQKSVHRGLRWCLCTDGQTGGHHDQIGAFRDYANAPKRTGALYPSMLMLVHPRASTFSRLSTRQIKLFAIFTRQNQR